MNLVPPLNYSGSVSPSPSPGPSSMQPSNEDIGSARKLTSAQPSPADASIGVSVSVPATPADPSIRNCGENPNSLPASIESDGMISELAFSMRHNPLDKPPQPLQQGTESEEHIDRTPQDIAQSLIDKFKAAKGDRSQRNILIKEDDINTILLTVREVFMSQPMLIEVEAPVKICGDIHGQFYDLLRLFDKCGYPSEATPFLFLGDYVDRGKHSIETITLLYCYKIIYPKYITLLRGNHECGAINRQYGFFDDVKRRYNTRLFKLFTNIFDTMPISCLVGTKIICMHGGLSPELGDLRLINQIQRPCDVPSRGIMCDLLWSDPTEDEDATGFVPSSRGVGWEFGPDMVEAFLDHVDLDLIVRAHQVMERGYGFFADRQLVTIFSAPDYCGEYDNDAAVMNVDEKLQCSFTVLPPRRRAVDIISTPFPAFDMATTTATTINTQNSKSLPKSTTPAQFPATLLAVGIVVIGTVVMTAAAVAISVVFSLDGAKDLAKHNARMTLTKCGDRVSTYLGAQAETAENMQYLSNPFDLPVAPANQSYWNTSEWYLPWMERMLIYHSLTGFELQFIGIGYADGSYIGCQYDQENENYVVCMLISQVGRNMSEPSSRAVHFFNNYSKSDGTLLGSSVGEIPYDPRTRDFFIETPRVKGFAMWSNVYIAAIRNTPIVSYLKPIYSKAGNFIGVASIDLSLEQVDIIFKKTLSGYDATSFLVDNHLRLVASTLERSAFTYDRSPVGYRLTSTDIENNCQLSDAVNSWENDTWKMCQLSIASYEYQPLIDLHHKRSDLFPSSPCTIRPVMSVTGNVATSSVQPTAATTQPRLVQWCEGNTVDQSHNAAANEEVFSLKLDGEAYYAMVTSMPILSKTAEMSWRLVVLLKESTQTKQVINGRNVAIGVTVAILVVVTAVVTCVMHRVLKPLATVADDMKSAAYLRTTDNSSQGQVGTWYEGDDLDKDGVTRIVKEAKPRDKPRLLSYLSEVATIQQSYWDMADELRKLKSYIPEHIRREVLTSRKGQVGAGQSVSTTANTNFSPSEVEMSRAGSFHGIEAMPSHPVSALISDNKHSSVLTAERLHANRKTPLAGQKASDWEVEHAQISSASQSARKDASPTAGSAEEYLSDRASEAKPISVAALSEWQMASRRCGASNESPPIFFGDNVLVDRDISVALVNVVQFHRFALTHSGPTITKEHEAIVHRVHAVARRCGGVLETFMGDHFWVSFNATTLCSSHAVAATCFALEITTLLNNAAIQNMKHIKKEDTQPMDAASEAPSSQPSAFKAAPCGVTCGVSSGRAFVGPLGTDSIRRHTILSQAMPEVAALERQSIRYPNCGLLVGGDTIPAIEGYFQYLLVDATLLPGSGGKRRRIATVKGAMCAEGCNPDALRGITNLEAARSRRQNPYALVNASFEAFLEGRTAECTDVLRQAEDQIIQSGAQSDQQPLTDEAKISISMMGELIIGMLSMSPPTDGRSYRSPLGEAYMPIGDRILYESNTT